MNTVTGGPAGRPEVSIVMANYNGARWLIDAIRSVQAQTLRNWELLIADDASTDDSLRIMRAAAADDTRIVVLPAERNQGPSGARNRALDVARGQWITIVDSDDLITPRRLETMVEAARRDGAMIVADDLRIVDEDGALTPRTLLALQGKQTCDAVGLVKNDAFGYLQPMFDRRAIEGVRYDEHLRVGEDFYFLLRVLAAHGSMTLYPEMGYLYRQRTRSLSKGVARQALEGMLVADQRFRAGAQRASESLLSELERRRRSLTTRLHWENVKTSLREKRIGFALREAALHPGIAHYALGSLFKFAGR
ncbi:glycosyltransferase family 2 protein [Paraburkholderia solisilvae]|uniref:Undecaprenyl-phosphate 4-deoxy-4-formamido-L-arabinose transferase n=1 Tax=Paraburkholderia solisilvae TaxID=624376 RepID=A0A6J5EPY4_9BURK|nr:glycosyltransferase family 2 protein [Paraburkholderia solisilvae]CAB3768519.1 Undecaprenyl-phosphate 4-deoxy-4-formamido-L-arabinose transferase [Paraburkholderia solisilvae]